MSPECMYAQDEGGASIIKYNAERPETPCPALYGSDADREGCCALLSATDHVQCDSGRTLPTKRLHFAVEKASDPSSED